ncbi:MAG TPA: class I SAM-dependent methyltransferase, partial [Pseudonocardia sp.]
MNEQPIDAVRGVGQPADSDSGPAVHPVVRHYTRSALLSSLLDALSAAGKSVAPIDSDDLSPMDEMHTGGRIATVCLADQLAPSPGDTVIDLGCGLGGVTRYLARHRECRVTGVDLTREHIEVADELTQRCGLTGAASFQRADITSLPFERESFDAAALLHVGMNVADKASLCTEAFRVLRPGGRFALYDVMLRSSADELSYPVPWASSDRISFLEPAEEYHRLLTNAG